MDDTLGPFNLILLAMPGLALIVVARTLYRPAPGHRPLMHQVLRLAGAVLLFLALTGAAVGILSVFALLAIPLIIVIGLMVVDRYRRGEHQALLYTLAAGARRGIPLNVTARAYAEENSGDTGGRAARLAEELERGLTLREAARRARIKTTTASKLSLRLGESLGEFGNVLFRSLDHSAEIDAALRGVTAQLFYVMALLGIGSSILLFVMLKIVPVFQKMFEEFDLLLPRTTVSLIRLSNWMVDYGWWQLGAIPLALLGVMLLGVLYYVGWLPTNVPLLGWLGRRYDNALVLHGLARCVQRRLGLPDAIGVLSHEFPRTSTAERLRLAWLGIQQGSHWIDAMREARLITAAEAAVLGAAERNGNLVWALDEMADSSLRRYILWLQFRCQIAIPLLVLLLGGCVGYIVIALMLPLAALIQGLS